MSSLPRITIITPSYNQGAFLERTILSVLNQGYSDLEYIIIDGGSTDESVSIIRKYESRLHYWSSGPDRGQTHAINEGLARAGGEVVNWLNSDDYLEPGALFKVADAFEHPETMIFAGYSTLHQPRGIVKKRTSGPGLSLTDLLSSGQIMQPSTFFRRSVFLQTGLLPESLHFMMDHYLWFRCLLKYPSSAFVYTEEMLAHVEMHENAKSVKSLEYFREDRLLIFASLFKAHQLPFITAPVTTSILLNFPDHRQEVANTYRAINFQLLLSLLFTRNEYGERVIIDKKVRNLLLTHYPFRIFSYFIKKRFTAPGL